MKNRDTHDIDIARLLQQQSALAVFGSFALGESDLDKVLAEAARVCADSFNVPFCKVCRYRAEQNDLLVEAGVGWKAGVVGGVVSQADKSSPQGRAFITGEPVICFDLSKDTSFLLPAFYAEHAIISTLDVVIKKKNGEPWGVLEIDNPQRHIYNEHDIAFVTGFANVLAEAVNSSKRNSVVQDALNQMKEMIADRDKLLAEKEVLAQELQHRVRNNLHLVYGMLNKQIMSPGDVPESVGISAIARRVLTLSKVYDHLLGTGLTRTIDFGGYLKSLCNGFRELEDEHHRDVELTCVAAVLMLELDSATALGLVVTELLSNSYLHAFPGGKGKINVTLVLGKTGKDAKISLVDDGVGFKDIGNSKRRGLGLVKRLMEQVEGTAEVHSDQSTTWELKFPTAHETSSATEKPAGSEPLTQTDVEMAWANRAFTVAYQPQFNLFTNQIIGFEALLRWHDPERGDVSPEDFIPLANKVGVSNQMGSWVLEQACKEAMNWPASIRVAVNVSPRQLQDAALPSVIAEALLNSGLSPMRLELEITESSVMPADADSLLRLRSIRKTGVRIAIDDFDIGYSALGYLVNFSFDKMKIDRSFTARVGAVEDGSETAQAIFRAIIGLCKDLNITVLAEGVETKEQLILLRDAHCAEIQGFLSGRPLPAEAIPSTLANGPEKLREMTEIGATEARAAKALWSENVSFLQIAEILNDIVIVTGSDLAAPGPSIVYVNPAFTRLTGYSSEEVIGKAPRILQGPGTSRATLDKISAELHAGRPAHEKVLNYAKSGAPYWLDIQITPLRDSDGVIKHFAAIERDVTLDKRRLDELEYLADRDTLTGIPNRRALMRAIDAEIETARQKQANAADGVGPCLIFLDVDHFKKINDELGHPIGDAVLCGIADCLAENIRRVDMLGRIGGEEFAVCMPAIKIQQAKALAARLCVALADAQLATPAGPVNVTVSIGVASFIPGDTAEALIARADAAMYVAKRAGRNRVRVSYTTSLKTKE